MGLLTFYFIFLGIIVCFFGRFLGKEITIKLNLGFLGLSFLISLFNFYESIMGSVTEIKLVK